MKTLEKTGHIVLETVKRLALYLKTTKVLISKSTKC